MCVADERIIISAGFYGYYPNNEDMRGWWSVWEQGCEMIEKGISVIAWMPLPEPYKEVEE